MATNQPSWNYQQTRWRKKDIKSCLAKDLCTPEASEYHKWRLHRNSVMASNEAMHLGFLLPSHCFTLTIFSTLYSHAASYSSVLDRIRSPLLYWKMNQEQHDNGCWSPSDKLLNIIAHHLGKLVADSSVDKHLTSCCTSLTIYSKPTLYTHRQSHVPNLYHQTRQRHSYLRAPNLAAWFLVLRSLPPYLPSSANLCNSRPFTLRCPTFTAPPNPNQTVTRMSFGGTPSTVSAMRIKFKVARSHGSQIIALPSAIVVATFCFAYGLMANAKSEMLIPTSYGSF